MMPTQPTIVELDMGKLEDVLRRAEAKLDEKAQGDVVFNDDTTVKILEMMGERGRQAALAAEPSEAPAEAAAKKPAEDRTGMFTSGIVATGDGHKIALFLSGRQHAGENLKDVLAQRAADLSPPIQMCDALARNAPAELKTILANCLAHGRRQFVDVADRFPEECHHVLEAIGLIYRNDALARQRDLSPAARLEFHQVQSGPAMAELKAWLARQFDERLAEPNSALGEAISYMLKHWEKLTLFLRVAGAPLGRVEVWRGGLGFGLLPCQGFPIRGAISACHAPFPHPAHRTGRADFPHPALLQNLRSSLSTLPRGFGAVGTPPASGKGRRRDIVCTPCRDAVPAASAICGCVAPCTCGLVDRPGSPALG